MSAHGGASVPASRPALPQPWRRRVRGRRSATSLPLRQMFVGFSLWPWKSGSANYCHMKSHDGLIHTMKFISLPLIAGNVSKTSWHYRKFLRGFLSPSAIGRKNICGGLIYFCSCLTICTRYCPFLRQPGECKPLSANGRSGRLKKSVLSGSVISLSTVYVTMKAIVKKPIIYCRILSVKNLRRVLNNGPLFISAMASVRSLNGRAAPHACALRCP